MTNSTKNIYPLFIDKIIKDFFQKSKYETIDTESTAKFIDDFCYQLITVFKKIPENCNYKLDVIKKIEIPESAELRILQNCRISIKFLEEKKFINKDKQYPNIALYYYDIKFQELVDSFLNSIKCGDVYTVYFDYKDDSIITVDSQYNFAPTKENNILASIHKITDDYRTEISEIKKSAERELSHVTTTNITTMGIFVAIIVAFISIYLSGVIALGSGEIKTIQLQFMFALFLGQILFNLIFFLLFMVARVAHRKISLECNYNKDVCKNFVCSDPECGALKRTWRKYPYMIVINIICIAGYVLFVDWWIIQKYVYNNVDATIYYKLIVTSICIILSIVFIELLLTIFVKTPMYSDRRKAKPYLVKFIEFISGNHLESSKKELENQKRELQKKIDLKTEVNNLKIDKKNLKKKYRSLKRKKTDTSSSNELHDEDETNHY